jgi:DNA-binding winged helix-turn-helix (wHTH) protein
MVRRSQRTGRPIGPAPARPALSKTLTLREALLAFGDPEEIAEMLRLEKAGYGGYGADIFFIGGPETQSDRDRARHARLHQNAEDALHAKLVTGEAIATGRDPRQAIDAARVRIPSERWRTLAFDFANSAAIGDGTRITEVLVPSVTELHIRKAARTAQLGVTRLILAPQSFDLLVMLAEAAPAPVAHSEIRERLFRKREEKAVGGGIAVLKRQMVRSGLDQALVDDLIVVVRRIGYRMTLRAEQVGSED